MRTRDLIGGADSASGLTRRTSWRTAVALAAAAIAATAGGVAASVRSGDPAPSSQPAGADVREIASAGLGRSVPVRLVIPVIDVDAEVRPVGLAGRAPAVPREPSRAGWYERGTSPGELGSAVIVGQASSSGREPAVFARLRRIAPGDTIAVIRADGLVASFRVDRVGGYSRRDHVHEPGGEAQLRLIPAYRTEVPRSGQVVVFATLVPLERDGVGRHG